MYYTYVLLSKKDNKFYTDYTNNLSKRLKEHKTAKVFSTRLRLPIILVYYEVCGNETDARSREKYLKSGMGKRYIKNRIKNYLKISNGV